MNAPFGNRLPGVIGGGILRGGSLSSHSWSGDWHLRPHKKPRGPIDTFARERRIKIPHASNSGNIDEIRAS